MSSQIKIGSAKECPQCCEYNGYSRHGTWYVLAKGYSSYQPYEYVSCDNCDNIIKQKVYQAAATKYKEKLSCESLA